MHVGYSCNRNFFHANKWSIKKKKHVAYFACATKADGVGTMKFAQLCIVNVKPYLILEVTTAKPVVVVSVFE